MAVGVCREVFSRDELYVKDPIQIKGLNLIQLSGWLKILRKTFQGLNWRGRLWQLPRVNSVKGEKVTPQGKLPIIYGLPSFSDVLTCILVCFFLSDPPPCLPLSLTCFTWLIGSLILKANGEGGGPFGLSINIPSYFGWMDIIQWWLVDDLQRQYWSAQNSSILVEMLKQKFGQNFEAEVWPILWSWILIILWYNSKAAT